MKTIRFFALLLAVCGLTTATHAKLNVVASTPDLGALAEAVGGDLIKVTSLARGTEDPHFVDPRPSFIRVLNQADLLLEGGAELEIGWLPPLVDSARNRKILPGSPGRFVAATAGVRLLNVPTGPIDRSQGDVHALGNPHFLLDPENARTVATALAARLGELDAPNAAAYTANAGKFAARLDAKLAAWRHDLGQFKGTKVITYHQSYDYLLDRFGLVLAGTIEPKPGIEPSPTHINSLIPRMKAAGARLVIIEPNRPTKTPTYVAKQIGATLVQLPVLPGGHAKARDYISLLDHSVETLVAALKSVK
jgi:zinc/manganese transport system substrate-binding protein